MVLNSAIAVLSFASLWHVAAAVSLVALSRRPRPKSSASEGVTVLKPLCGVDTGLRENLQEFFRQDHPRYELVFGVEGEDDAAIPLVRELMAAHPEVHAKLVVHHGGKGLNPKVSNLRAMLDACPPSYDLLLISDSNVRVSKGYVRDMEATLRSTGAGLVTSVVSADGAKSLGALLDNTTMNSDVLPGIALLTITRLHSAVLGKSMLFRRIVFDRLGGFESVASLLAEDYVMGRMFSEAGYRIAVAHEFVWTPSNRLSVRSYFQRHLRWAAMRWRLAPGSVFLEALTKPLTVALLALGIGLSAWSVLLWALTVMALRDAVFHCLARGSRGVFAAVASGPVRELSALVIALAAPFVQDVCWRGKRVRLAAGTRLYLRAPRGVRRPRLSSPT